MDSAEKVQVNAEWLKWARKTAHYNLEDISKKMDVDRDIVETWEKTGTLEYDKLLKLAEYYRRSPKIFFNGNKPKEYRPPPDFRTIQSKNTNITPLISFEIRNARNKRKNLLLLESKSDEYLIPKFDFVVQSNEDVEELGEIIREKVDMTFAKIHLHKNKEGLDFWIKKVEELGILVFQFYNIKPEEMRGYALFYDKLPIIGINNREHPTGKKFTLFHELAHIILKKEGISNFESYSLIDNDEKLCNSIAAETLVPKNALEIKIRDIGDNAEWTDMKIKFLKNYFHVSPEVIIRRLLSLKKVSKKYYKENKEKWDNYIGYTGKNTDNKDNTGNYIKKEQNKDINKVNAIKASMALRRNGIYYTEMVLSAYDSQLITDNTMSEYLGEPLQVIQEIRKKLIGE